MSTHRWIDRLCIAAMVCSLLLTVLFMNGAALGIEQAEHVMGYENRLFDTSRVHTIDIVMDNWDSFIETCENEEYAACSVVIDGEHYSNVGIRAKGNTSLSSVSSMNSQRYSFKVEFDQYDSAKSYYGLDKLSLNNLIQDNTLMKDYLTYQLMAQFGAAAPLCSYAYITVNGEDWGLYLAVEAVEDSFLQRNYGSNYGELYKPDSLSFGGGRGNGKDFNMDELDFDFSASSGESEESSAVSGIPGSRMDFSPFGNVSFDIDGEALKAALEQQGVDTDALGIDFESITLESLQTLLPRLEGVDMQSLMESMMGEDFSARGASGRGGNLGAGGFSMGADDVKLQYIDDDPASYANIFDNAKTDISQADQTRLIRALKALSEGTDIESTVDVEAVIRYFVVHNFVSNDDSYTGNMIHNYYLYEKDGQLSMIPWDYNLAFGSFQGGSAASAVNDSIDFDLSDRPMVSWIFESEEYTQLYHQFYEEFAALCLDSGEASQLISQTAELIAPYVEKDPSKFCTMEEFEAGVAALSQFVSLRSQSVNQQLAGDDTPVETGDLNLSDMGSMSMGGGFGGDMPQMPEGMAFSGGTDAPQDMTFPEGAETPQGMAIPEGAETPQGMVIPEGAEIPQEILPASEGDTVQDAAPPENPQANEADSASQRQRRFETMETGAGSMEWNFPGGASAAEGQQNSTEWILVGVSFLVLLLGLAFAIGYKR